MDTLIMITCCMSDICHSLERRGYLGSTNCVLDCFGEQCPEVDGLVQKIQERGRTDTEVINTEETNRGDF